MQLWKRHLPIFICIALNTSFLYGQGQWIPAASMHETRQRHGATVLADGTLLVSGGAHDFWGEAVRSTCELYNPNTDTWNFVSSMTTPRSSHTTTLLTDGRVLVTGGYGGTGFALASCEIYNPSTDTWTSAASMHIPRYRHQAILLNDDSLLIIGGRQGNLDGRGSMDIWSPVAICEIYCISTNTWTQAAPMHEKRVEFGAALLPDGRVLVAGGINAKSVIDNWAQPSTATCEIYDPVINTWTLTDMFPNARNYVRLITLDNNYILSIGGELNRNALDDCYLFRSRHTRWYAADHLNAPRITAEALKLPNGDVMTIGGWSYLWIQQTNTAERYHVRSNRWEAIAGMHQNRGFHSANRLTNGDIIVAGGTTTSGSAVSTCEIYREDNGSIPFKIGAIGDVPGDEGKQVTIFWPALPNDTSDAKNPISTYEIYRRDDANGQETSFIHEGRWILTKTVAATQVKRYSTIVPTSINSTIESPSYETFVIAGIDKSGQVTVSNPMDGESFDNRGPSTVNDLTVTSEAHVNHLVWTAPSSTDVVGYEVYRSEQSDFPISPQFKIGESKEPHYTDFEGEPDSYYRIVGIDNSENLGTANAPARSINVASTSDTQQPTEFTIGRNYPHPFTSTTYIPLTLPSTAEVQVQIFDQYAHLITATAPVMMNAGEQEIVVDASHLSSGTYHCIVRVGEKMQSLALTVIK